MLSCAVLQGMAFVAGVILMYLPEEPAFRVLCQLLDGSGQLREVVFETKWNVANLKNTIAEFGEMHGVWNLYLMYCRPPTHLLLRICMSCQRYATAAVLHMLTSCALLT